MHKAEQVSVRISLTLPCDLGVYVGLVHMCLAHIWGERVMLSALTCMVWGCTAAVPLATLPHDLNNHKGSNLKLSIASGFLELVGKLKL